MGAHLRSVRLVSCLDSDHAVRASQKTPTDVGCCVSRIGCSYVTKHTKHKRGYGFDNDCEPGTSLGGTTGARPSHFVRWMAR